MIELTEHEVRILTYLEEHGPTHRAGVVCDLAAPDSRIGQGVRNGSNSAIPLIMGSWCKRLIKTGLVSVRQRVRGLVF
jgi:hypothetical protein